MPAWDGCVYLEVVNRVAALDRARALKCVLYCMSISFADGSGCTYCLAVWCSVHVTVNQRGEVCFFDFAMT